MADEVSIADHGQPETWRRLSAGSGVASHEFCFNQAHVASGIEPHLVRIAADGSTLTMVFCERTSAGGRDIATVLSVSGASLVGHAPPVIAAWTGYARAQGWIAGYLQFGPDAPVDRLEGIQPGNHVFLLDLTAPDPLARASTVIRRKIKTAARDGASLVTARGQLTAPIVRLYDAMLTRSGARSYYWRSPATLESFVRCPGHLVLGAALNGEIEAIALYLRAGPRAEFHIGASSEHGRSLTAWLHSEAIAILKAEGTAELNLGGGVRVGDGLHAFKSQFGGAEKPLWIVRQIYDPERYRALCEASQVPPGTTWFPAYRWRDALPFAAAAQGGP